MNATLTPAVFAVLAGCLFLVGCDSDGDGFDDATGEPVPTRAPASGSGCGPGGWEPLCGGEDEGDQPQPPPQETDSGCGPGGWELLCGEDSGDDSGVAPERMARVARHEAGHVAAFREYGGRRISAFVYADGSGRSYCGRCPEDPRSRVVFAAAGAIAAGTNEGNDGDEAAIDRWLARVPAAERDGIEAAARAEAAQIVRWRAEEIEQVAGELLHDGSL